MGYKFNEHTGHFYCTGSETHRAVGLRSLKDVFGGADGERLRAEIAQDYINRGACVPEAIKVARDTNDKLTHEEVTALHNVEQLRKKRLWMEKVTGVITEAEYQKQLKEGSIV